MDAIEEVKSRLNIEDVIGEYVQLKRAGRNWKGLSPFSDERSPSFMVSPEKQIQLALFLASESSNHITGKLIHVNDDWRRFERENMKPELYTLRRVQKI